MKIQEALNSGKPFRRKSWSKEYSINIGDLDDVNGSVTLSASDILATDWEIKHLPLEFYVNVFSDGSYGRLFKTRDAAEDDLFIPTGRTIKVREVVE